MAGAVSSRQRRLHARLPDDRRLARRSSTSKAFANSCAARSKNSRRAARSTAHGRPSPNCSTTCRCRKARRRSPKRSARAESHYTAEVRRLHYLSVPPSAALSGGQDCSPKRGWCRASRVIMEKPFGVDLASAIALNKQACTRSSPKTRSSASTTSSARSRRRTFSPFVLPTACSSRSGTAISSTTCRSTCRRRSASASARPFYEQTGAYRDMVVTHLFQILGFMAMEPPTALEPNSISEEKNKVFRSMPPIDPHDVVRGQYIGYRQEDGRRPGIRHRDLHRAEMHDRQLALGRRAVLPAHRQADGRGAAHHLDRVPRAAEEHVPRRIPASARRGPTI